jgi:hypothetical protein
MLEDKESAPEQIARTIGTTTQAVERTIKLERLSVGLDDGDKTSSTGRSLAELLKEVAEE